PTGGGWGFRFFPRRLVERTVGACARRGVPAVIYLHPRELDPHGPRVPLSPLGSFVTYGPRSDASAPLSHLLERYRTGTLAELVEQWEAA
ncbi:MAG TPA: DUF3473 domain-containing protein, partial [Verrucomicrobiae bacterium]|nr:DUF3473 domain-containing protein [Verrucomicrobiae bacterium]